jgi:hypothetical protein
MRIFERPLPEYVSFAKPFIVLMLVIGLVRLSVSLAGVPDSAARWISTSAAAWIAVFYYGIRVQTSGFGSYKQLLPVLFLVNAAAQIIAMLGILVAIITGQGNIYTVPEYAFGADGATWLHFFSHLFFGTAAGSVVYWLFGCLIMFVSGKLLPKNSNKAAARA